MTKSFLVWLDRTIDLPNNEDCCMHTISKLYEIFNTVNTFTDVGECINFINNFKQDNTFVTAPGQRVFCGNRDRHKQWIKQWSKIKGACKNLEHTVYNYDQNSVPISFLPITNGNYNRNLQELDKLFMYTQLLKEILLIVDFQKIHVNEFISHCRRILENGTNELKTLDKLDEESYEHTAIWWYTYPCFLYSMINQSLRMMEIDQIILMGSFVRDLNNNIAEIHAQQLTENSCRKPLIAYRAIHCKINQQILSPTRVNLAASYNNIGLVYGKIGDYLNALLSYQRALEIYLKTLPSKHSDLATFYNNIGSVYDKIGDDSNSLSSHNKALEIRQKTLPLSHPHLATSYNNIAVVYAKMNDYSNALLYYQEALAIDENNLSSNSSDSYLNIGMFFSKTGEHSEAVRYCEKVLEIAEYSLQGNHRRIQVFRNALKYEKKKCK
ncbi:unnamed protein product [Rotaria socialis]|uniref:Uncharacterized protein n=1 Tax=Rotaria socialis TaxID=392032 RepID=A0A817TKG2_9BILA|nr:unnamed protein product [Rotaria socialis]